MVRIRHPNLFVDKCDGNIKILLVHSEKKRSACRNLFFNFFVHLRKIYRFQLPNYRFFSAKFCPKLSIWDLLFQIWGIFWRIFTFGAKFPHCNGKFVGLDIIFSEFW